MTIESLVNRDQEHIKQSLVNLLTIAPLVLHYSSTIALAEFAAPFLCMYYCCSSFRQCYNCIPCSFIIQSSSVCTVCASFPLNAVLCCTVDQIDHRVMPVCTTSARSICRQCLTCRYVRACSLFTKKKSKVPRQSVIALTMHLSAYRPAALLVNGKGAEQNTASTPASDVVFAPPLHLTTWSGLGRMQVGKA